MFLHFILLIAAVLLTLEVDCGIMHQLKQCLLWICGDILFDTLFALFHYCNVCSQHVHWSVFRLYSTSVILHAEQMKYIKRTVALFTVQLLTDDGQTKASGASDSSDEFGRRLSASSSILHRRHSSSRSSKLFLYSISGLLFLFNLLEIFLGLLQYCCLIGTGEQEL